MSGKRGAEGGGRSRWQLDLVAERFRVLGDSTRLEILQQLGTKECSVSDLVAHTGLPQSTLSRHLQALLRAHIVTRRKEGLYAFYSVADPTVARLCDVVCGCLVENLERELSTIQGQ